MVVRETLPVTTSLVTTSTMLTAASNANGQYINPDDILNPLASSDVSQSIVEILSNRISLFYFVCLFAPTNQLRIELSDQYEITETVLNFSNV